MTDTGTKYDTNSTHQCFHYIRLWEKPGKNKTIRRLAVGWSNSGLTLEFTDASKTYHVGGYVLKSVEPSEELRSLVGLFVVGVLPASILADKLQDEWPEFEWAAEFLREWERAQ